MTVKDILSHFTRFHKVTIIEHNGYYLNVIYEGFAGQCSRELPDIILFKSCIDWKVIHDMLNIWV